VNVRRFLWAAVITAGVVMAAMVFMQRHARQQAEAGAPAAAPAKPAPPVARPAPATRPTPAIGPASVPASASAPAPVARSRPAAPAPATKSRWNNPRKPYHTRTLGDLAGRKDGNQDDAGRYMMQVTLTNYGAAIENLRLADYFMTVADKRRHDKDPAGYAAAVAEDRGLLGHYALLKPVGPEVRDADPEKEKDRKRAESVYPLATRRIIFPEIDDETKLNLHGRRWQAGPVVATPTAQQVTFTSTIARNGKPFVRIEKTYELAKGSYSVKVSLRVVNESTEKVTFSLTQYAAAGVPQEDFPGDQRMLIFARRKGAEIDTETSAISDDEDTQTGLEHPHKFGRSDDTDNALWIGSANRFFAGIAYVLPASGKDLAAPEARAEFFGVALPSGEEKKPQLAGIDFGAFDVAPGAAQQVAVDFFAGPKQRDVLGSPPYGERGYKEVIQFGRCCSFAPLSLAMMWLLSLFSKAAFGNYGLAIIVLVVIVRVILHPLTKKGQVSMMGMQKLKPKMEEIREKYKNDKAKLNEETMKLYKSGGMNPMLGCLPMFLQMPIWIALWTGIQAAVELRHAAFLPVWITDLAAPDALIPLGSTINIPLIGGMTGPIVALNLLPILLTVAMFLQQKFSPQAAAATSDQQASTQKQMMYIMPVFMLLIFYNRPSGLTLYIMASTFAGVGEQYFIRRHIRQREADEAAMETKVAMPGKRFRGQKPKKPKGPIRTTR